MQPYGRRRPKVARRPVTTTPSTGVVLPLPPDLADKGARRVGFIGLIAAITAPVAWFAESQLQPMRVMTPGVPFPAISAALLFLLGMALFVVAWSRRFPSVYVLDAGLIFQVLGALAIAVSEHAYPLMAGQPVLGISWNCVWITIFVVAVPGTYGKAVLATVSAALMQPVGLGLVTLVNKTPLPSAEQILVFMGPIFAAAAWTIPIARHLHSLRAQVTREREMGSYRLTERLGSGGMGEVWRAEHRMLARTAAIKLIRGAPLQSAGDVASAQRRFEREARATAMLRSPHTVALYDYGVTEEGEFYYVMELLEGIDLDTLVKRFGPQPAGRVVRILRQACNSLAEAHEQGIVHRDIKPRNMMLCRIGVEYDFLKILDFGLARNFGQQADPDTRLTAEGFAAGTPAFMAPEAAVGQRSLDGRADIYCLGCVAYWLLTGKLVFERESQLAMVMAHISDRPTPPSACAETDVPRALDEIVVRCLEKSPEDRPRTARDLDRMLAASGLENEWTQAQAREWWHMHAPKDVTPQASVIAGGEETL